MPRLRLLLLCLCLMIPVVPLLAQRAGEGCPPDFAGLLAPRLVAGEGARVVPGGAPNRLRDAPSLNAAQIGAADPGTPVDVLDGPVCDVAGGVVWWQVRAGEVVGWTAEGVLPDDFFLEPVPGIRSAVPTPTFPAPVPGQITPENAANLDVLQELPFGSRVALFAPDGSQLALSNNFGAFVYALPTFERIDRFMGVDVASGALCCLSRDGRWLVRQGDHPALYSLVNEDSLPLPGDVTHASDVAVTSGVRPLVIYAVGEGYGSPDSPQIYVYDTGSQVVARQWDHPAQWGASIALSWDETRLMAGGDGLRLYDIGTGEWTDVGGAPSSGDVAYRPVAGDAAQEIAVGGGRALALLNLADRMWREYALTRGSTPARIAFSPNGRLVAAVTRELEGDFGGDARFHLFDAESGALLLEEDWYAGGFAFSPDGTLLIVSDGNERTWVLGEGG